MCNALGIVNFPGSNVKVKGMHDFRPIAAFSFLGRYRMVDFPLSNLSNSGIEEIHIHLKNRPRSVIGHVGLGRQYNINPKRGGIHILYGEDSPESEFYNTDIASFKANLRTINKSHKEYVVIAPSYMLCSIDYEAVIQKHIANEADVTVDVSGDFGEFENLLVVAVKEEEGILHQSVLFPFFGLGPRRQRLFEERPAQKGEDLRKLERNEKGAVDGGAVSLQKKA